MTRSETRALTFQVRSESSYCEGVTHANGMDKEKLVGVKGFEPSTPTSRT